MYVIMWEFHVKRGQEPAFRQAYGAEGDWARLFRRGAGYLGTELLWDERDERRYVTIDRWSSRAAYDTFRSSLQAEYHALDQAYELLTDHESLIGTFTLAAD